MNDAVRAEIARLRGELFDIRAFAEAHHADEDSSIWLHGLTVDIPVRIEAALFPVPTSSMTPTSDPQEPVTRPPSAERIAEVRDLHRGPKAAEWHHNFHRDADGSDSCDVCALLDAFDAAEARAAALVDARPDAATSVLRLARAIDSIRRNRHGKPSLDNSTSAGLAAEIREALAAASPDSAPAGLDVELLLRLVTLVRLGFLGQTDDSRIVAAEVRGKPHRALLQTILAAPDSEAAAVRLRATPASTTGPGAAE